VQNNYSDASVDVDEFMWNHPDFLIVFACGNRALGGVGTIGSPSTAKNGMATGATYNGPSAIYLSDISAWGPTADGRIKPDVVGNGAGLYSTDSGSDTAYRTLSGTSMASPNVAGTAVLLIEHFENQFPSSPRGATTSVEDSTAG
jgi:subtilisin family serine protease